MSGLNLDIIKLHLHITHYSELIGTKRFICIENIWSIISWTMQNNNQSTEIWSKYNLFHILRLISIII